MLLLPLISLPELLNIAPLNNYKVITNQDINNILNRITHQFDDFDKHPVVGR